MDIKVPDPTSRRTLAVADTYEEAQAIVDRLADSGFPVQHVAIVGRDLHSVEQVTGHLNGWKAALSGAGSGLVMGALFGLIFGLLFTTDGTSLIAIVLYWMLTGAVFVGAFALLGYLLMGGRRNFTSVAGVAASRFEVVVDNALADEALSVLARPPTRSARVRA